MAAKGDHDARRGDVAAAVWRILAAHGFDGLTLRSVAAEMGASTGLLTHYFTSKRDLVRYAYDVAVERTDSRPLREVEGSGLAALRAALHNVLSLTPEDAAMNRVWVSFWDAALGDDFLSEAQRVRYEHWRARLRGHVEAAQRLGELSRETAAADMADEAAAFTHGLVVHALFDTKNFPARRQVALLDDYLSGLTKR